MTAPVPMPSNPPSDPSPVPQTPRSHPTVIATTSPSRILSQGTHGSWFRPVSNVPRSNIRRDSKIFVAETLDKQPVWQSVELYLYVSGFWSLSRNTPTIVSVLAIHSTPASDQSGCSIPHASIPNGGDLAATHPITNAPPKPLSPSPDPADYPPSHNVFFVITRIISRPSRPPNPSSRNVSLAITLTISGSTRQVTMYSLRSPPPPRDSASAHTQATMYSSQTFSSPRDPPDHRPSHNVFFTTTLGTHPPVHPPTKSQRIPGNHPQTQSITDPKSQCILCDYSTFSSLD